MDAVIYDSIPQLVQLSIAPVFLLTSVAAFLGVLANRLSRIIDRVRTLKELLDERGCEQNEHELSTLFKRMRLINWSISLFTAGALLICLMIALLFIGNLLAVNKSLVVVSIFICTMGCLIVGLLFLQAEIYLAIRTMRLISG